MSKIVGITALLIVITGCVAQPSIREVPVPLSFEGTALTTYSIGAPVCRNIEDPQCGEKKRAAVTGCLIDCSGTGTDQCDPEDLGCLTCARSCDLAGDFECDTVSIFAECSNCADDLIESVKVCSIPNIIPGGIPERFNQVVPCDSDWESVGECTECTSQDEIVFPNALTAIPGTQAALLGRRHCECPDPEGLSWTSTCRVPTEVPRLLRD